VAAADSDAAGSDAAGADALGAVVAAPGLEHATARTAIAARPSSRLCVDPLIIRSPPLRLTRRSGRVVDMTD
jgi:hypothetical protein